MVRTLAVRLQEIGNLARPRGVADGNSRFRRVPVHAELPGLAEADAVEHLERAA